MKKFRTYLIAGLIAVAATLITQSLSTPDDPRTTEEKSETVFERVMRTGTLRCGYNFYEPGFMKDEKTGEFSGLFYDLMEELGALSNLKIEWTKLVGWGNFTEEMQTGKVDAFCISVWPNALRGRSMLLSNPFLYINIEAYGRADDTRFDKALQNINNPDVIIGTIDSEISADIARNDFPKAQVKSVAQLGTDADLFNDVRFGKADVTFTTHSIFLGYDRENPGALKRLDARNPLRSFGTTIALPMEEFQLKFMLDTAIEQMVNNGYVDRILARYQDTYPDAFFPVAKPYRVE